MSGQLSRPIQHGLALGVATLLGGPAAWACGGLVGENGTIELQLSAEAEAEAEELDYDLAVSAIVVRQGTVVRFVVRNGDPIAPELVVGDADVHARHATGTEAVHPPVPGEVSVGPNEDGCTFYEVDEAGTFTFACHLPRHVDHGMVGEVVVRP
jgi:uncharacterized cupredoxin-like copper-binding protein